MKNRTLKKINFKKIIISFVVAFALFASSFSGYNFNFNKPFVEASYKQEVSLISNNDFNNYSSSDTPASPSNWTHLDPTKSEKIKSGVINVYPTLFPDNLENYELEISDNPGVTEEGKTYSSDNAFYKHLMINSYEGFTRAGYESSSFSLAKDSYYAINVIVKTISDARAAIYLKGLSDDTATAHIESISSDDWQEFTIFVATNNFNNETVTLQLWLGGEQDSQTSNGAVFFNKVNVVRYSQSTHSLELYYAGLTTTDNKNYVSVDLNGQIINNPVANANFEDEVTDINIINGFKTLYNQVDENEQQFLKVIPTDANYNDEFHTAKGIVNPKNNNLEDNKNVLFMYNKTSNSLGIESSDITIKQQSYYKISVWAKTNSGEGSGATIKLVEKANSEQEEDEDFVATEAKLTVATTETTNVATNNWTQYSFFVEGHPLKDTIVNMQLWLGTKDSPTSGYVFFDNLQLQEIKYSFYSVGSGLNNSTTFSFNTYNNQFLVANGNFNLTNNQESELVYPLNPRNWTLSTNDDNFDPEDAISGVINTNDVNFEAFQTALANSEKVNHREISISNPGVTPNLKTLSTDTSNTSNNVLIIGNPYDTNQTYKSESINLTASSYYKISFSLNTQYVQYTPNTGAKLKINGSEHTVYQTNNLDTFGQWETYSIYLSTNSALNVTIELSLLNVTGFAFYDDIEIVTISETVFNNAQASHLPKSSTINYNNENFNNYYNSGTVNTPYTWSGTDNQGLTNTMFGIVNQSSFGEIGLVDVANPNPQYGNDVLMIGSVNDTYFTASSLNKYNLEAGKYYKISVFVKTFNINQESVNSVNDSNDQPLLPGASIKLTQFSETFKAINTETFSGTNLNEWVQYDFYVNPNTEVSTGVEISLGYKDALTAGYVFADTITMQDMEKEDYVAAVNSIGTSKTALSLTKLATEEEEPQDIGKEFEGNKFDWLLLSSLLLVLSLIIALVGTSLRRFSFKPKKRIKTTYDRRRTVELEMNKRERIEFRRNIISDLKLEFDVIDKEIEEFLADNDARKEELKQRAKQRREKYQTLSKAIVVEITNLNEAHNQELQTIADEKLKAKLQLQFNKKIEKLKAKEERTQEKSKEKERRYAALEERREKYLQQQQYRKKLIQEEIDRIESEIEAIAREEEIMWSEYRKAKEEAKKAKMEYMANKRAQKRTKQTTSKNNDTTTIIDEDNSSITSDIIHEIDDDTKK